MKLKKIFSSETTEPFSKLCPSAPSCIQEPLLKIEIFSKLLYKPEIVQIWTV